MSQPIEQIEAVFAHAKAAGRPAFMPYFTLGYPDYATSLDIVAACAAAGADLMELGLPFSDPLADGPTIQHSTQVALDGGMTMGRALEAVAELRQRGVSIPFMLMGYYNPVLAYGIERFAAGAAEAGANGFIIPDLPPEEAGELQAACHQHGLGLTFLLAPTSTPARMAIVGERARGFTYLVSLTGVTGARAQLSETLEPFVRRVREHVATPLAVGFGISTPAQARAVGSFADGVIVGSRLVTAAREAPAGEAARACGEFVEGMVAALGELAG